jgi:hypothetical protein
MCSFLARNWLRAGKNGWRGRLITHQARFGNTPRQWDRRVTALSPIRAERKKNTAMQTSSRTRTGLFGVVVAAAIGVGGQAFALDPNAGVTRESGPFDLFKFGFSAYKSGPQGRGG